MRCGGRREMYLDLYRFGDTLSEQKQKTRAQVERVANWLRGEVINKTNHCWEWSSLAVNIATDASTL